MPPDHPQLIKGAKWLLSKEIRDGGDWQIKNRHTEPGCWAFEFENCNYPDIDDTAVVTRALNAVKMPTELEETEKTEAILRGINWTISMQGKKGGRAAFDLNNNKKMLEHIPFSDFMTPLDPVSHDVTNHAIELLSQYKDKYRNVVEQGLAYLKKSQKPDGAWYGRWGVNYLYGTGLVLPCLQTAGADMTQEYIQRAVKWLKTHHNPDGSWGESCRPYEGPGCGGQGETRLPGHYWG